MQAGIRAGALFSPKARKWVSGRKGLFRKLEAAIPADSRVIWVHCASLGEFEQGRPLMEKLRADYPHFRILLTFFSPSGYEVQKNYAGADWVFYLPADGPQNARRFLEIVHPSLVIFVKYEFWYYYLKKIKYRNIPLLLVSALFRKEMSFFHWYGTLQRKMLSRFDHLFVQNASSLQLISDIGLGSISSVSGDTRFDRVIEIAEKNDPIPGIEEFAGGVPLIVAGSTWPEDEEAIRNAMNRLAERDIRWVLAPHEISAKQLDALREQFPGSVLYSGLRDAPSGSKVLIMDNMGMLSRLYRYATIAYVGGGFKPMGVHNVLEPAVYGKPVLMGPYYHKYAEAVGLVHGGGGISLEDKDALADCISSLLDDTEQYESRGAAAARFVLEQGGATRKIMDHIQENRLLTR